MLSTCMQKRWGTLWRRRSSRGRLGGDWGGDRRCAPKAIVPPSTIKTQARSWSLRVRGRPQCRPSASATKGEMRSCPMLCQEREGGGGVADCVSRVLAWKVGKGFTHLPKQDSRPVDRLD